MTDIARIREFPLSSDRRRFALAIGLGLIAMAAGIAGASAVSSAAMVSLMTHSAIFAFLGLGVGFLLRQGGVVSFGHATWFGLSAYIVVIGTKLTSLPIELVMIGAVIGVTAFAFLVALVIARIHGLAFSMLTLAIGQAFFQWANKARGVTGGADGVALRYRGTIFGLDMNVFHNPFTMFVVCWVLLIVLLLVLWVISRSRFGLLSLAIRENEERALYIGYQTRMPRVIVFTLSAAVTSIGGILFVLYNSFVSPELLHWSISGTGIIIALVGGTEILWGPIVGSFFYYFLREFIGGLTEYWLAVLGIILITVTLVWPSGISGGFDRLRRAISGGSR